MGLGVFTTGRDMQCLCCAQLDTHIREDHTQLLLPEAAKKKRSWDDYPGGSFEPRARSYRIWQNSGVKGGRVQSTRTVGSTAARPSHHINVLHAVFLALWHFLPRLQGFHVIRLLGQIIRTDSMVAAVYVVEQICHGFRWAEVNLFASMESTYCLLFFSLKDTTLP